MHESVDRTIKRGKKGFARVVFGRSALILVLILLQFVGLWLLFSRLENYIAYVYGIFLVVVLLLVVHIINKDSNPAFKIAWLVLIMGLPVVGTLFYFFVTGQVGVRLLQDRLRKNLVETRKYLRQEDSVLESLEREDPESLGLAVYMNNYGGYPIYRNSEVTYFPLGENKFEEMLRQLEEAKKFIFLEYFIVDEGEMWNAVLDILRRKVKEGVEVRFLYDGLCTLKLLPVSYPKQLLAYGIQCRVFSPLRPALSTVQNNRDHRKILVIDGHTAFTGGVNLADEYINRVDRFGHWKDTAIMVKGEAVTSFTMMFLQMWNLSSMSPEAYQRYIVPPEQLRRPVPGYVMPYGDSPLDNELVGSMVYMDIINRAKKYVHICTPYLVLDNEMVTALRFAAKRGVEVQLILPHHPDKKYAYLLARVFYEELIPHGVQIYEYLPGFVHAKSFVSDDRCCTVGTINLDFRSLYLHFECGTYMTLGSVVADVERDFQETKKKCRRITEADCKAYPWWKRMLGYLLRVIAPQM
ncbi:MAG: cardiolipin synthase [Clostridiales bacterium]|nr:cardiolipin synthase [Clostridiales bacterium]